MSSNYRIKKTVVLDWGMPRIAYLVQMRFLWFFWITIREYIEEYPESNDCHPEYAKEDSQALLNLLEEP